MNRTEWIDQVVTRTGKTKTEVNFILTAALDAIGDGLVEEGKVSLTGFGTFEARKRAARTGKGPSGTYSLPERIVPVFRAGQWLKDAVK